MSEVAYEVNEAEFAAMEAIFSLCKAIEDGGLSIAKLEQVARIAVEDGHRRLAMCLSMASIAVERAAK